MAFTSMKPSEIKQCYFFDNFKMALYGKQRVKETLTLTSVNGKTMNALTVFTASLHFLKYDALKTINNNSKDVEFKASDFTWVLTVPAIWDDAAKQFMREAATRAGIVSKDSKNRLVIALEPEAASIWCKKLPANGFLTDNHSRKEHLLTPGTQYIVVDCGGGTIDITAHEVLKNGRLKELQKASGNNMGGQTVDRNFLALLKEVFGECIWDEYKEKFPNETMVPAHVAAEDALEWFFDHNIAKQFTDKEESSDQEEEEEKEVKEEEKEEVKEEEQKEEVKEEEKEEVKEEEQKEVKEEAQKEEEQKEEEKEVKAPGEQPHPEACKKEDSSSQKAPAEPELQIRNVMCSSSLNCSLDTQLIARMGRNAEYVRKFKQVRIRIRSPRATALISTDGRMMSSGADSVGGAHRAARRLARIVQKLGFPVRFSSFKVHNFMVMFHTFPLSLERLYVALWGHCSYEPELFTGLFYYSGRITACVRHTGDVSLTDTIKNPQRRGEGRDSAVYPTSRPLSKVGHRRLGLQLLLHFRTGRSVPSFIIITTNRTRS
uniref:Uncharacterized protein n=1 Tax=Knipowitschia caucasica TaxID=637954 RepID=A0AAV2LAZ6_KNICA